jgi:hypothetical protein
LTGNCRAPLYLQSTDNRQRCFAEFLLSDAVDQL